MAINARDYRGFKWTTGDASNYALAILLPSTNYALHVARADDVATDWNLSGPTNPRLYIHNATTPATNHLMLGGDQVILTNANLGVAEIGVDVRVTVGAANNQLGMSGYYDATINGTTAGHCYGFGSWINSATGAVFSAGNIIVPFEGGVYTGQAQASARVVFAGQHHAILDGAPTSLHAWRLNTTQTVTAVIAAANSGSVGYAASAGTSGSKVGDVPLFDVVGHGVRYVRLYDAAG